MGRIPLTLTLAVLAAIVLAIAAPTAEAAKHTTPPPAPRPTPQPNPAPPPTPAAAPTPLAIPTWVDQRPNAQTARTAAPGAGGAASPTLTERTLLGYDLPLFPNLVPADAPPAEAASLALPAAPAPLTALRWVGSLVGLVAIGAVLSRARLVAPPAPLPPADAEKPALMFAAADDPQALLVAAKQAVENCRLDEAVLWFDQALRLAPDLGVAHFCRGVCLVGLERHEEAYAALRRAYELDPQEGAHRLELARACGRTGRASEAMSVLGPLLAALPTLIHEVRYDPAFACLADHPRWLVMTGSL